MQARVEVAKPFPQVTEHAPVTHGEKPPSTVFQAKHEWLYIIWDIFAFTWAELFTSVVKDAEVPIVVASRRHIIVEA